MKDCKKLKRKLVDYLNGEILPEERGLLESHLADCPECRLEFKSLEKVMAGADSLVPEIESAMRSVDWDRMSDEITSNVFKTDKLPSREKPAEGFWSLIFKPRFRPVLAALFFGVILGVGLTFLIFRWPSSQEYSSREFMIPQGVLDSMNIEVARRETLDYLEKSQYLLLDFIQSTPENSVSFWQNQFTAKRAKDLLSKKKYINQQLNSYQMAKAKAICDQIEYLFLELTQLSSELPLVELQRIQQLIQERQLLLKIKLVKQELERSEV